MAHAGELRQIWRVRPAGPAEATGRVMRTCHQTVVLPSTPIHHEPWLRQIHRGSGCGLARSTRPSPGGVLEYGPEGARRHSRLRTESETPAGLTAPQYDYHSSAI